MGGWNKKEQVRESKLPSTMSETSHKLDMSGHSPLAFLAQEQLSSKACIHPARQQTARLDQSPHRPDTLITLRMAFGPDHFSCPLAPCEVLAPSSKARGP